MSHHPSVVLFSIIALEKFAQTSKFPLFDIKLLNMILIRLNPTGENKMTLNKRLNQEAHNPMLALEKWSSSSEDPIRKQIGFCTEWCLDNLCNHPMFTNLMLHLLIMCRFIYPLYNVQLSVKVDLSLTKQRIPVLSTSCWIVKTSVKI